MNEEEKKQVIDFHNSMLNEIYEIINSQTDIMIVLDEFIGAYNKNMLNTEFAEKIISTADGDSEIILTGREPADFFIEKADYVSEINEVKHPYKKGITARFGIEY